MCSYQFWRFQTSFGLVSDQLWASSKLFSDQVQSILVVKFFFPIENIRKCLNQFQLKCINFGYFVSVQSQPKPWIKLKF